MPRAAPRTRHPALPLLCLVLVGAAEGGGPPPERAPPGLREWIAGDACGALAALEGLRPGRERDHNRAVVLLYDGKAEQAEAELTALRAREPRWAPAVRWLARAQAELGRPEALDTTNALLALPAAGARDHLWAAGLFARSGDLPRARDSLRRAVAAEDGLALAWSQLREVEAALGGAEAGGAVSERLGAFAGEAGPPLPPPVVEPGETLRYRVKYLFLRLASLTIETRGPLLHRGREAQVVTLLARSNPAVPFFHIDSRFESVFADDGSVMVHRNVVDDSNSGKGSAAYEMDPKARRCTTRYGVGGLFGYDVLPLPEQAQDGLSVLLLMRSLSRARASASVLTVADLTFKPTRITTLGVERIHWHGREVEAVHVQSVGAYRGPGGLSGAVDAWVSNDQRAVPLRARMKIAVGSVGLELLPDPGGSQAPSATESTRTP